MAVLVEKQAKRWTYEEYYKLDDDQRYVRVDHNFSAKDKIFGRYAFDDLTYFTIPGDNPNFTYFVAGRSQNVATVLNTVSTTHAIHQRCAIERARRCTSPTVFSAVKLAPCTISAVSPPIEVAPAVRRCPASLRRGSNSRPRVQSPILLFPAFLVRAHWAAAT